MKPFTLSEVDKPKYWLLLLLFISSFLHLYHLNKPQSVVFDEFHFGKFINTYGWSHENIFSIHPPHLNLIMAGFGKLLGYDGSYTFGAIGESFTDGKIWTLRLFPALCGTLLPFAVLLLLMEWGAPFSAAFLAACFILFDNSLTLQSRIIAYDIPMLLGDILALYFLYKGIRKAKISKALFLFFLSGLFSGLALGGKFTGLISIGLSYLLLLYYVVRKQIPVEKFFLGIFFILLGFVAFYGTGWWLHFYLIYKPGPGDAYYIPTGNFIFDTIETHKGMFRSNYYVTAGHPDGSPWWAWPLVHKPLYYWNVGTQKLYFVGNTIIWLLSLLFFVSALFFKLIARHSFKNFSNTFKTNKIIWVPIFAYFWSYLSYVSVPRVLFMYHYLPPLIFSILAGFLFLNEINWFSSTEKILVQNKMYYLILGFVILGFLFFVPFTYAMPLPKTYDMFFQAFFVR